MRVLVFTCGACLMSWEIAGSRLLGPSFGSTIYVWGSLIGVIMAALSCGYYLGGILADRRPSLGVLCLIVAAAGILLLIDMRIHVPVCRWVVKTNFGPRFDPLIASVILFIPASVLLGMVSPFAVRLETRSIVSTGSTAGSLYALSTVGSIAGTMLTAFFLLETLRVSNIILLLAATLILSALYLWLPRFLPVRQNVSIWLLISIGAVAVSSASPPQSFSISLTRPGIGDVVIKDELDSAYQHIIVLDWKEPTYDSDGGYRLQREMIFDRYTQSAVYPESDFEPATRYTEMFYLPFIFNEDIRSVLIVGLGGGTGPRMFQQYEHIRVDSVEIDPKVLLAAEKYFGFVQDDRIVAHIADGRVFVQNTQQKYDLIILDAYSVGGRIPFHLLTLEFYQAVLQKLNPGGLVMSNIISPIKGSRTRLYRSSLKTFNQALASSAPGYGPDDVYVFRKRSRAGTPDTEVGNIIFILAPFQQGRLTASEIEVRARRRQHTGLVTHPEFLFHARQFVPESLHTNLDDVPVLTDDYAPVDLMLAELR